MKFLIAFALFAVAYADIEPFRLREAPAPAIEGSSDYPYLVKVVQSPTPVDAQESPAAVSSTANIVKVDDFLKGKLSPIDVVKATFEDAEPSYDRTVKFVDQAVNEEHVDKQNLLGKVVESPLENAAPSGLAVNVVDEAINNISDNESLFVKVVKNPLEDAVPSELPVIFFDKVVNDLIDDENYEESPLDKAVNKVVSHAGIAPSFDSYAGISKLIDSAQEEKYVEGSSTPVIVVSPEVLNVPTAVNVVENTVNMGHMLVAVVEDSYEDPVDVHAKAEAFDDINANDVRVAGIFSRGKVFDNPMLR